MHGMSELAIGALLFRPLCRRRLQRYSAAHAALAARNHLHRFSWAQQLASLGRLIRALLVDMLMPDVGRCTGKKRTVTTNTQDNNLFFGREKVPTVHTA